MLLYIKSWKNVRIYPKRPWKNVKICISTFFKVQNSTLSCLHSAKLHFENSYGKSLITVQLLKSSSFNEDFEER